METTKAALAIAMIAVPALDATAAPLHLAIDARNTVVSITSDTLLGKVPARFTQIEGRLDFDPALQTCRVRMTMPVKSLTLDSAVMRSFVMSEGFLDPDAFPTITVSGVCRPEVVNGRAATRLVGEMTMRGQTRPVSFVATNVFRGRLLTGISSVGTIDRRNWGVGSLVGTVEPELRVTTTIDLAGTE